MDKMPEKWENVDIKRLDGVIKYEYEISHEYVTALEALTKELAEAIVREGRRLNSKGFAFCIFCGSDEAEGTIHDTPSCPVLKAEAYLKEEKK